MDFVGKNCDQWVYHFGDLLIICEVDCLRSVFYCLGLGLKTIGKERERKERKEKTWTTSTASSKEKKEKRRLGRQVRHRKKTSTTTTRKRALEAHFERIYKKDKEGKK